MPASLVAIIANSLFPCFDASLQHTGFRMELEVPGLPWCPPFKQDYKQLKCRDENFYPIAPKHMNECRPMKGQL